jgi:hypothetical protein
MMEYGRFPNAFLEILYSPIVTIYVYYLHKAKQLRYISYRSICIAVINNVQDLSEIRYPLAFQWRLFTFCLLNLYHESDVLSNTQIRNECYV